MRPLFFLRKPYRIICRRATLVKMLQKGLLIQQLLLAVK